MPAFQFLPPNALWLILLQGTFAGQVICMLAFPKHTIHLYPSLKDIYEELFVRNNNNNLFKIMADKRS